MRLKLGTRGSALALAQSEWVAARIRAARPGLDLEIVRIVTSGDRSQASETPLSANSEKGVFVKEIELALLAREIDLAVHSMKDLAADLPEGLTLAAVPERADARDVIVGAALTALLPGARVGTGSIRRQALLAQMRPDLILSEIRGNIDTRLAKLARKDYDAIVLAAAGLARLGRADAIAEYLDPSVYVPDPGQGALAIETRADNPQALDAAAALNHPASHACVRAERAFLRALGGGCTSPLGAWARSSSPAEREMTLTGMRATSDGEIARATISGSFRTPEELGAKLAEILTAG